MSLDIGHRWTRIKKTYEKRELEESLLESVSKCVRVQIIKDYVAR